MAAAARKVAEDPAPCARCAPGWYAHGAGERPARVQLDLSAVRLQSVEVSGDYNIWYGRYAGERGFARSAPAATRCHLDTDAGLTMADHTESNAALCLHFARGACGYGKACNFRHRAPLDEDESSAETRVDVFGRERHAAFRDDMGGVGSWARDQRTLYVGRICVLRPEAEVHATVWSHFSEWGEIDYCRVLMAKGCAFVSYRLRAAAEFAKEAMADQALEANEQLNVRWATEDPNPRAKAERLRASAQALLQAMRARGHAPPEREPYAAGPDAEGHDERGSKRARLPQTRDEALAEEAATAAAVQAEAEAEAALAAAQLELAALSKLDDILGRIEQAQPRPSARAAGLAPAEDCAADDEPPPPGAEQPARPRRAGAPPPGAPALALPPGVAHVAPQAVGLPLGVAQAAALPPGVEQPHALPSHGAAGEWAEWMGMWDSASGHAYYYNATTGESRWAATPAEWPATWY
jgi:hypothetical protein